MGRGKYLKLNERDEWVCLATRRLFNCFAERAFHSVEKTTCDKVQRVMRTALGCLPKGHYPLKYKPKITVRDSVRERLRDLNELLGKMSPDPHNEGSLRWDLDLAVASMTGTGKTALSF